MCLTKRENKRRFPDLGVHTKNVLFVFRETQVLDYFTTVKVVVLLPKKDIRESTIYLYESCLYLIIHVGSTLSYLVFLVTFIPMVNTR